MTDSTKTTEQSQQSTTNPWAPAQGLLTNLLGQYGGMDPSVTAGQSSALANLQNATGSVPNFGDAASGALGKLFGSDNSAQVGMLNNAYSTLQGNLGATARGDNLDPYKTAGFSDAINAATSDITNKVKGVYAGSGRDPSGAGSFAGSLGRGLEQGIAPTIAAQFNQNYSNMAGANSALLSGAGSTASGINSLNQSTMQNLMQGIGASGSVGSLYTSPAMAQYAAANQSYSQPYQNLAQLLQPSVAIAGLGGQSAGSGTSTQTSMPSLMDSLASGTKLGGSWLSGAGSAASSFPAMMAMFSDERLKKEKEKVGVLYDGTPVWSYSYIGEDRPHIGVMAQDLEKTNPDAVSMHSSGFRMVDYGKVRDRARDAVGMLRAA
jgi:hypothetical protein